MENNQITIFLNKLAAIVSRGELVKLVVAKQRNPASELKSMIISIVEIKAGKRLNFIYRYKTKDITKNLATEEALPVIRKSLEEEFLNAELFATGETVQLTTVGRGKVKIN